MKKLSWLAFFLSASFLIILARISLNSILPVLLSMQILFGFMLSVTLIAILRDFVGVTLYGIFGPAIISIGLLYAGLYWGLIIFFDVLFIGLISRLAIEPLKLSLATRMAVTVLVVALAMVMLRVVGVLFYVKEIWYTTVFPILITSWLIDRFCRFKSEKGWRSASMTLSWTVIAILGSFFIISNEALVYFFISTPEAWIILIAVNLFLGTKVRFRVSEFLRFSQIRSNESKKSGDIVRNGGSVLTMNIRNREVIGKYNPDETFPYITKLSVKRRLSELEVPVPEVIATISDRKDLGKIEDLIKKFPEGIGFVIKPDRGSAGRGILVIRERKGEEFIKNDGTILTIKTLIQHISEILDGKHSSNYGQGDTAYIEKRVISHPSLGEVSFGGLPDIRVIVFNGFPIMTMARFPTKESNGVSNIHKGAIGAGVNLLDGRIFHAIYHRKSVLVHPDTGKQIVGLKIPYWRQILMVACQAQKAVKLGYAGVDVALDEKWRPLILEVNKRPGLEIQNANLDGILHRLTLIEKIGLNGENMPSDLCVEISSYLDRNNWEVKTMGGKIGEEKKN